MFKSGDKVIYKASGRNLKAKVLSTEYDYFGNTVTHVNIEFKDSNLIPPIMRVGSLEVEIDKDSIVSYNSNMDGCTCGLKFVREGGRHSDYCDLYRKEDN